MLDRFTSTLKIWERVLTGVDDLSPIFAFAFACKPRVTSPNAEDSPGRFTPYLIRCLSQQTSANQRRAERTRAFMARAPSTLHLITTSSIARAPAWLHIMIRTSFASKLLLRFKLSIPWLGKPCRERLPDIGFLWSILFKDEASDRDDRVHSTPNVHQDRDVEPLGCRVVLYRVIYHIAYLNVPPDVF